MRDFLKIYLPIALIVAAGFVFAWLFVDPAPPKTITIATGAPDGAYAAFGKRYAEALAASGLKVKVRHTAGAKENVALLLDPKSGVDVALVQGGIGDPFGAPELVSLASLFYEPVWVLVRGRSDPPPSLKALKGKRIGIGAAGSGTRVLAKVMLSANDVDDENATFVSIGGAEAVAALTKGELDAAIFVSAWPTESMRAALARPDIRLMDIARAKAYKRQFPYLADVELPAGVLDLAADIPPRDLSLVAPTAALVARNTLHPAVQDLLLGAATTIHRPGTLTSPIGAFPSPDFVDFPLSSDAARYFKSGPTFLRRVLPFWAAVMVERLLIMVIPLITLMIPLFKIAPPAYRWNVRRRIYRWYKELREIEESYRKAGDDEAARDALSRRLDDLQRQVGEVHVPLSYTENLYHLRLHISFVKQIVESGEGALAPPATAQA